MLYQQFTGSPRFFAGENVHCVRAAMTASSVARPSIDPRSRLTWCGWPVDDTSTRATAIFLSAPAGRLAGSRGSTRVAMRGGSSTSFDSKNRPVSGAGGRADATAAGADALVRAGAGVSGAGVRPTAGTTFGADAFASRTGSRRATGVVAGGLDAARDGAPAGVRCATTTFGSAKTFAAEAAGGVTWTGGASRTSRPGQSNPSRRAPSAAPITPTITAAAIISIGA